jgi:hypothetical protein
VPEDEAECAENSEKQKVHAIDPEEGKAPAAASGEQQSKASRPGKSKTARARRLPSFLRKVDLFLSQRP